MAVTLATQKQLQLMDEFCVNHAGLIGIDMTYTMASFYVTPTTFRHPLLIHAKTLVEPAFIGPTLIHTENNEYTYHAFASDPINASPKLTNAQFLGSDRAIEMYNGFKVHRPNLQHMVCYKHVKDNVDSHPSCKLPTALYNGVHEDIFETSLDSLNEEQFDSAYAHLKPVWHEINPDLEKWFTKYQATTFRSLVQQKRLDDGLGEKLFYNNANESINNYLKSRTTRKSTIPVIVNEWEKLWSRG